MKKKFRCTVCGYVHEGDEAPEKFVKRLQVNLLRWLNL